MEILLENGEQMVLTNKEVRRLESDGLIYRCKDEECGFWHLEPGRTFEQIESTLKNYYKKNPLTY